MLDENVTARAIFPCHAMSEAVAFVALPMPMRSPEVKSTADVGSSELTTVLHLMPI